MTCYRNVNSEPAASISTGVAQGSTLDLLRLKLIYMKVVLEYCNYITLRADHDDTVLSFAST